MPSCSNLSPPPIIPNPNKEKQLSTAQQVSKPKPAAESTSLDDVLTHHPDITVTDNSPNKGPDVNSFFPHLAEIVAVEQADQLTLLQASPFSNHNNYLAIPTAHSQGYTRKYQLKQPIRNKSTRQCIAKNHQYNQSILGYLLSL
ncbi:MAG: hypothetical protein ACYC2U_06300 [Candidatus Amoebophilus sp.]